MALAASALWGLPYRMDRREDYSRTPEPAQTPESKAFHLNRAQARRERKAAIKSRNLARSNPQRVDATQALAQAISEHLPK